MSLPLLNKRPDLFHSILFAAAALGGGISFLQDVSVPGNGNAFGPFNKSICTPSHWMGWTSAYHFFNYEGERDLTGRPPLKTPPLYNVDAKGNVQAVPCNMHDLKDWIKNKIGPYHPQSSCTLSEAVREIKNRILSWWSTPCPLIHLVQFSLFIFVYFQIK